MTAQDKALELWAHMTPDQRSEIMEQVGYIKSMNKWFRACIAHVAKTMVTA